MDTIAIPVTDIQSIGPVTARKLKTLSVHSVADLLLASDQMIHRAVSKIASAEEVRLWRRMAALLEIRGMNPQWAEALAMHGLTRVERVYLSDLRELQKLFRSAKRKRLIPDVPDTEQIASMQKDAAVLHHTGTLVGHVSGEDSKPLANVEVRHGKVSAKSDRRGRFRLTRLPLDHNPALVLKRKGFQTQVMENPRISSNEGVLKPNRIVLKHAPTDAPVTEETGLSEFAGDRLPAVAGQSVRMNRRKISELQEGDIVQYRRNYADGKTIELVSRFRHFVDGEFVIDTYRVSRKQLPETAKLRDHFKRTGGDYRRVNMTPKRHQYELAYRRLLKKQPDLKPPRTQKQFSQRQKAIMRLMD